MNSQTDQPGKSEARNVFSSALQIRNDNGSTESKVNSRAHDVEV